MVMIFVSCIVPEGECSKFMYGGPILEPGLDMVNEVVRSGAQLTSVELQYYESSIIQLPIEAFDGHTIGDSLRKLEQEWKLALLK